MQFTFKRDGEGRATISIGDTLIAGIEGRRPLLAYAVAGVTYDHLKDAIERADEADFWEFAVADGPIVYLNNEITVEVPT